MVILFLRTYKKSRYPIAELLSNLRVAGYPSVHEIEYAILEANGAISILPKRELVPLTPKDLNIEVKYALDYQLHLSSIHKFNMIT